MENEQLFSVKQLSSLLDKMKKRLLVSNHSPQTVKNYLRAVEYLSKYIGKHPHDTDIDEITDWLYNLRYHHLKAWRTIKIYVAGLRWYYSNIENNEDFAFKIPYPKEEKDLPVVCSRRELYKLFNGALNLKHKVMLMLLYSSGMRRNELLNLKIEDIDTQDGKHRIRINSGKGHKDRYTVLSKKLLPVTYHHTVFTVPAKLRTLFKFNKQLLYNLLFKAAWQTIDDFSKNPQNKIQAEMGMIAILHTWKQDLQYHPHLHCIVPAGGITS